MWTQLPDGGVAGSGNTVEAVGGNGVSGRQMHEVKGGRSSGIASCKRTRIKTTSDLDTTLLALRAYVLPRDLRSEGRRGEAGNLTEEMSGVRAREGVVENLFRRGAGRDDNGTSEADGSRLAASAGMLLPRSSAQGCSESTSAYGESQFNFEHSWGVRAMMLSQLSDVLEARLQSLPVRAQLS